MDASLDAVVQLIELAILIFLVVRNVGFRERLKQLEEKIGRY